jgi:signal peptidase I
MKVLNIIGQVMLYFVVIFMILLNIFSINNKSFFGFRVYRVISGSMQPTLQIGDIIIIRKEKEYHINDIITYDTGLTTVTHRIKSIDNNGVVTKGDANDVNDDVFNVDKIVGKYFFRISMISLFSNIMIGNSVFIVLIVLFSSILILTIFYRFIRNIELKKDNLRKKIEFKKLQKRLHKESLKIHKKVNDDR